MKVFSVAGNIINEKRSRLKPACYVLIRAAKYAIESTILGTIN